MANKKIKTNIVLLLPVIAALFIGNSTAATTNSASVDLSKTEDLFSQPIKPNPLTSDPAAVVVRVNGEDITRGEITKLLDQVMQQFAGRVQPQQMQTMRAQMYERVKDQLITKKLLDKAVADAKIVVPQADIDAAIAEIKANLPEGKTLEDALKEQDMTLEKLTESIKDQLAIRTFMENQVKDIADATEAEAKEYYDTNPKDFTQPESVTASHILIKVEDTDTPEQKAAKKAKLEKIRKDIIDGKITFEDAAAADSDCPSKAKGGQLGTFQKGQMVPEFEVAAFSQEPGEVGDVIETQFGYHIIKVTKHTEEGPVSFEDAKADIIKYVTDKKKQEAIQAVIKKLHDNAKIEEVTTPTAAPAPAAK